MNDLISRLMSDFIYWTLHTTYFNLLLLSLATVLTIVIILTPKQRKNYKIENYHNDHTEPDENKSAEITI